MDEIARRAAFHACLLNDEELARPETAWRKFTDPFPEWSH
jgi:hypothetical protein